MISSGLLLLRLASISLCVLPAVRSYSPNEKSEIVNFGEITYQIILQNANTNLYFCGGSIVSMMYVLTAAECVVRRAAKDIIIHAAILTLNKSPPSYTRTVDEIIIHEQYDISDLWRNNIALLKIRPIVMFLTVVFHKYVKLAPLSTPDITSENESVVRVSGFGIISEDQEPVYRQLMKRNIYISPWKYCKDIYKAIHYDIAKSQICAYDPISYTQNRTSDIGGPLVVNEIMVGIASSSVPDRIYNRTFPILFTSISSYREWINLHINP